MAVNGWNVCSWHFSLSLSFVIRYISSYFLHLWFLLTHRLRSWAVIIFQTKCDFIFVDFIFLAIWLLFLKLKEGSCFIWKTLTELLWKWNPVPVTWLNASHMFSHLNFASFGCGFLCSLWNHLSWKNAAVSKIS